MLIWCVLMGCVLIVQGIENISVQSSVSLQHLPYDKDLEKIVKASIADRLSFATQKLAEIVKAAKDAPTLKDDQIKANLPAVGMPLSRYPRQLHNHSASCAACCLPLYHYWRQTLDFCVSIVLLALLQNQKHHNNCNGCGVYCCQLVCR